MYQYNKNKIAEFAAERDITASRMAKKMELVNPKGPKGWLEGGDLRVSSLLNFVNTYGLNLLDFFSKDGQPLSENQYNTPTNILELELHYTRKIAEIEKQYLREIMDLKVELAKRERTN